MPAPRRSIPASELAGALVALRAELGVPDGFPAAVEEEAAGAAAAGPNPEVARADRRDIPLLTVDPEGSRDLDQALAIEGLPGGGHRAWYAIADVAAFVVPGGEVHQEAMRRGSTLYLPGDRAPLHPTVLSEGAASLLAGQDRPAVLWRFDLDADGAETGFHVERAIVRSREQLSYVEAQQRIDAGDESDGGSLVHLRTVGERRLTQERARGGVSLELGTQEVVRGARGWELRMERPLPVEAWSAQLSLLTGLAAARLQLDAGLGLLRTLPAPDADAVEALRAAARALGRPCPSDVGYAELVRSLDPSEREGAALLALAARALRGAGYLALTAGTPIEPAGDAVGHAAVGAPYSHVTAPLRRLADRFAAEVALAAHLGEDPPRWATDALGELPAAMAAAGARQRGAERAAVDLVEALLLDGRKGEVLDGSVVSSGRGRSVVALADPPVLATVEVELPIATDLPLRVAEVDVARRHVSLEPTSA